MVTNRSTISGVLTNLTNLIMLTKKIYKNITLNIENQSTNFFLWILSIENYLCKVALVNQETLVIEGRRVIEYPPLDI